jgi:hypothetical protein
LWQPNFALVAIGYDNQIFSITTTFMETKTGPSLVTHKLASFDSAFDLS